MTARVILFPRPPVRAFVVEQLNEAQWHAFVRPDGSAAVRASGVGTLEEVIRTADIVARLYGLPVLMEGLDFPPVTLNQARRLVTFAQAERGAA